MCTWDKRERENQAQIIVTFAFDRKYQNYPLILFKMAILNHLVSDVISLSPIIADSKSVRNISALQVLKGFIWFINLSFCKIGEESLHDNKLFLK